MARKDDVVIKFGADDSRFQKTIKNVSKAAGGLTARFKDLGRTISESFDIGAGIAGGGVIAGVARLTQQLDELGKTADALNTTVENLSELQFAVSQTSTTTDRELNTALQRLAKHIGQANRGVKESQKLFEELGLDWEYMATLDLSRAFLEVADATAQMENAYDQASISQKLFEDQWRKLLPTIKAGSDALRGYMAQAREMGTPTTQAAEAAAQLNDSIGRLNQNVDGLVNKYGPGLIDLLNMLITKWTDLNDQTNEGLVKEMMGVNRQIEVLERRVERMGWFFGEEWVKEQQENIRLLKQYWMDLSMSIQDTGKSATDTKKKMDEAAKLPKGAAAPKPTRGKGTTVASVPSYATSSPSTRGRLVVDEARTAEARSQGLIYIQGQEEPITRFPGYAFQSDQEYIDRRYNSGRTWDLPPKPNPQATAQALADFRSGRISATELGRQTGLQAEDVAEPVPGAFGTLSNTLAPLPSAGQAGIRIGPDPAYFTQAMRQVLSGEDYLVRVRPVIVDDANPIEHVIDQVGGRD